MKPGITQDSICFALMSGRGDLFLSASYLGVSGRELAGYIRASDDLQVFVAAIGTVKNDAGFEKLSAAQFTDRLATLTREYQIDGLEVVHEMATMSFDNAAMADVKLKAAINLRGLPGVAIQSTDRHQVMAELNQIYQQSAPRIKSVRLAQIEYMSEPSPLDPSF
jgi:hypothetical protein